MKEYCAKAGIRREKAHMHALKHSCGTHLAERGIGQRLKSPVRSSQAEEARKLIGRDQFPIRHRMTIRTDRAARATRLVRAGARRPSFCERH
jgi:hypothetical protein